MVAECLVNTSVSVLKKERASGQRSFDIVACAVCESGCSAAEGSHYVQSADLIIV